MKKPSPAGQATFWALIAGALFITCISFVGFLNRFSASSGQKWGALSASVIGAVALVVIWRMKDEILYPQPKSLAPVEKRPLAEQQRYYRNSLYANLGGGWLGSLAYWFIASFFGLSGGMVWAVIGYVMIMTTFQAAKAAIKLLGLRKQP